MSKINSQESKNENSNTQSKTTTQPLDINKNILILNYIYDNSIEQLRKMDLKNYNLNFQEEFKHISLDTRISPLILACYLGRCDIVKFLFQNTSIDINQGSEVLGLTPLSVACMCGFYELAEFLIKKGADVNKQNKNGQTPFYNCFARLEEEKNYFENKRICMKLADLLLNSDANIDEIVNENKGYTMLMVFCSIKTKLNPRQTEVNKNCIKYLIENGASTSKLSKNGKTIFQLLQKHQNKDAINQILNNTTIKRKRSEESSVDSSSSTIASDLSNSNLHVKQQSSRLTINEDICQFEGITRESSTCCSIFSFF